MFGLGKPHLGGLSVTETEELQMAVMQDGARRGHATQTKRRRNVPKGLPREGRNEFWLTR